MELCLSKALSGNSLHLLGLHPVDELPRMTKHQPSHSSELRDPEQDYQRVTERNGV